VIHWQDISTVNHLTGFVEVDMHVYYITLDIWRVDPPHNRIVGFIVAGREGCEV
jgi:hypothetical protein